LKLFLRDYVVYGDLVKPAFRNYYLQTYNQGLYVVINPLNVQAPLQHA
jgi:hypothetical protein